ncbi:MAG: hypothetical protein ACRECH_08650 [Nitrososphaerales archaeon]
MTEVRWDNAEQGLCVVCGSALKERGRYLCVRCGNPCEVEIRPLLGGPKFVQVNATTFIGDAKSKCCGADVEVRTRITDTPKCHKAFVDELVKQFGEFKKVIDQTTGIAYRVPTKDIIESGLKARDLARYPRWGVDAA